MVGATGFTVLLNRMMREITWQINGRQAGGRGEETGRLKSDFFCGIRHHKSYERAVHDVGSFHELSSSSRAVAMRGMGMLQGKHKTQYSNFNVKPWPTTNGNSCQRIHGWEMDYQHLYWHCSSWSSTREEDEQRVVAGLGRWLADHSLGGCCSINGEFSIINLLDKIHY